MSNYGFGLNNNSWNESRKDALATALRNLIEDIEVDAKFIGLTRGQRPYVLVDEPARGITIMNIAYLAKEFQNDLINGANRRYLDVMTGRQE